ncbi:MAG: FtsX-like permease family protein [Gammaproteobacteria bacterium]|nr:FtsX-like permease family protein [Gammaproteobacteria bacterium]MYK46571.1 FtsX-like permease family protein [Gammaproteobacteria bacterium]
MTPALAVKFAMRDWRAGELRLLIAALLVAVGSVSSITLFVDRLQRAIEEESTSFLGADRVIGGSREIPDRFRDLARDEGLTLTDVITFNSMVYADASGSDRNQLASVKAVAPGYPLRGVARIAEKPFAKGVPTSDVPGLGEVWMDSRLFPALGVEIGDRVAVGYADFTVTAVLAGEPDRGGSFMDFGPRLLMRFEDIPATQVVQPGSRIGYTLMLAGEEPRLRALFDAIREDLSPNYRWRSIRDTNASIGRAIDRAESFLLLGGLLAVLLAGIAVALAANRYARRHFDHVGVLKTLGATPREIQWGYLGVLLVIGVVGTLLGLALGGVVHLGIIAALGDLLPPTLPLPGLRPLLVGSITGFICLLAFALPPLLGLKKISPMRVIRRDLGTGVAPIVTYSFAAAGSLGLLIWHSGSVILTVAALVGAVVTGGTFAVLALILLRGGRVIGMQAGSTWRLALAGLQRRYRENVAQIVIFGFAIMLLLVMLLVRTALVEDWQAEIPESTPNHFLMNVMPSEAAAVQRLLTERTDYDGALFPMIRGRINAVNDVSAREWRRRVGPRPGPGIRSERNLTFSAELPDNNVIVAGEWWSGDGPREPAASLEDDYASSIGVSVGDTLTFDIGGLPLTVPVTNLRSVEWDSLQPNFFIIFSPGTLDEYPATFMTSFHLSREEKPFLNELLSAHPTITLIEVDEIILQVRSIIDRVTQTVELVLYLVLGAGVLVLIASIGSSRDQRLREHALLRALGGTRPLIQGALVTEFAILGLFAGIVAVIGAEITVFTLNREIFELPTSLHFWLWATGPAIGMAMIATVGYLGTRKLVSSPPATVLREV